MRFGRGMWPRGTLILITTSLRIEIEGLPVSANAACRSFGRRVVKTVEARRFERLAMLRTRAACIAQLGKLNLAHLNGEAVRLTIEVHRESWRGATKATCKRWVQPDVSNFIKYCEDAVFKALGLNDGSVVELVARKIETAGRSRTVVVLAFI